MGRPVSPPCGCTCGCGIKSDPMSYDDHSMTDLCVRCGRWANDPEGQPMCSRESVCDVCGFDRVQYDWAEKDGKASVHAVRVRLWVRVKVGPDSV